MAEKLDKVAEPAASRWDGEDAPEPSAPKVKQAKAKKPQKSTPKPVEEKPAKVTVEKRELEFHDQREHLNIVFIGHVDAGKSTISGQIMLLTGQVDPRTIAKYEKEAKEKNRDSWYLAFIMDTNEEERAKGKTVEVGRAHFTTDKKRFTLLDAPGHKNYVPNMITGTCQADVGVLVISARKGEFETGFDRGGQTREHAMLAKTLGIQRLIVMVNKMDESTVKWSQERFTGIQKKLNPFLRKWGYKPKKEVVYIPVSGYTGANIKDRVDKKTCPWFTGESFMEYLDSMPPLTRHDLKPLRIPINVKYKEMGSTCIVGKVEAGTVAVGDTLMMMPNKIQVECTQIIIEDEQVKAAKAGENVVVGLKGIEEEDIHEGFVLSHVEHACSRTVHFAAEIVVTSLLEHKPLLTAGYDAVLHVHSMVMECQIKSIISAVDKAGKEVRKPRFVKEGQAAKVTITMPQSIAVEEFDTNNQMGRFTLRDEGKSIAVGKILKLKQLEG
jgi:peptide chain release factor subunit 3